MYHWWAQQGRMKITAKQYIPYNNCNLHLCLSLHTAEEKKKRKKGGRESREAEDGRRGKGRGNERSREAAGRGDSEGGGDGGGGGGGTRPVDHSHLSCQHHLAMVGGMALGPPAPHPPTNTPGPQVLLLGLGGGLLATYIHKYFPKVVALYMSNFKLS